MCKSHASNTSEETLGFEGETQQFGVSERDGRGRLGRGGKKGKVAGFRNRVGEKNRHGESGRADENRKKG